MVIQNTAKYNEIHKTLWTLAMNGRRYYFPYCTIEYNSDLGQDVAVLFQSKQVIPGDLLDELLELEFSIEERKQMGRDGLNAYMNRLVDSIKNDTLKQPKRRLSGLITELWPVCDFDEWLEETVEYPWMTASYQVVDDWSLGSRYFKLTCKYHAIVNMPRQQFEDGYGSAFLMTKMGA